MNTKFHFCLRWNQNFTAHWGGLPPISLIASRASVKRHRTDTDNDGIKATDDGHFLLPMQSAPPVFPFHPTCLSLSQTPNANGACTRSNFRSLNAQLFCRRRTRAPTFAARQPCPARGLRPAGAVPSSVMPASAARLQEFSRSRLGTT